MIGSDIRYIAKVMTWNSTIQMINLLENTIGTEGARAIAEALKINSSLKRIYLDGNVIGIEGARAILLKL